MEYIEVRFSCTPNNEVVTDLLADALSYVGFDSFVQSEVGLNAYIKASLFSEEILINSIRSFVLESEITYEVVRIEDKNWNEEWEKHYFEPIVIDDKCIIRSSFHKHDGEFQYKILIDPKMAFGTGHHQTTRLMIREILSLDLVGKSVLDMGCGTSVLAILSSMHGAERVRAIDIDEWSYNNSLENIKLNGADNIQVSCGDASLLGKQSYDVILANINRNILLQDMRSYVKVLSASGLLVLSGFYTEDIPVLIEEANKCGLMFMKDSQNDNWASITLCKG